MSTDDQSYSAWPTGFQNAEAAAKSAYGQQKEASTLVRIFHEIALQTPATLTVARGSAN